MVLGPYPNPPAWPDPNLPDWLARRAAMAPGSLALLAGPTRWSFAELDYRATETSRRLAALGAGPGQPVALLCRNGPAFVELVHALIRLGAVLVPLNTRLTAPELVFQVDEVAAQRLIVDEPHRPLAARVRESIPDLQLVTPDDLEAAGEANLTTVDQINLSATHCVVYTSGTTGPPKGALLTYGNHWWSAIGSALNIGLQADDRWLAVLPLFHVGGLAILLRGVIYGIPVVVQEAFDPAAVNRAIDDEGVTIISVVSAMLTRMLAERGDRAYPPTLRCVLLGGGPAPRPLLEACADRGVPVVQTYGLSETASQVATLAPAEALRKLGASGKPLLPTELRIEQDGRAAAAGEVGEILVRGPTVTPGYVRRPDATALALRDGWLHTGDLGYLDADGYLYVVDRRDDLIISGGENVYPAEIEGVLLAHPRIAEAGVYGVPDERWGQVVGAVLVPHSDPPTIDELRAFCRTRLAGYKVPTYIRYADALPRNAAGKLLRRDLPER
jgi:o-succinylbenzoate---CoA ligase